MVLQRISHDEAFLLSIPSFFVSGCTGMVLQRIFHHEAFLLSIPSFLCLVVQVWSSNGSPMMKHSYSPYLVFLCLVVQVWSSNGSSMMKHSYSPYLVFFVSGCTGMVLQRIFHDEAFLLSIPSFFTIFTRHYCWHLGFQSGHLYYNLGLG